MSGLLNIPTRTKGLNLQTKVLALIGIMLIVLIVLPYALSKLILLDSFASLEDREVHNNTERVLNTLDENLNSLNIITIDWAHWNDLYQFMQDRNPAFLEQNMDDAGMKAIQVNLVLVLDNSGQLVLGKVLNPDGGTVINLSPQLMNAYLAGAPFSQYTGLVSGGAVNGVLVTPYGTALLAVQPILDSRGQGPSRGTFIFGRMISITQIKQMAAVDRLAVDFKYANDTALPGDFKKALGMLKGGPGIAKITLDSNTLAAYTLVNDISGRPALVLRVETSRDIYQQGQKTVLVFLLMFLAAGLLLAVMIMLLINRQVLVPVLGLDEAVRRIGQTGDAAARVPVRGHDELSRLGRSINAMLDAMQRTQSILAEKELNVQHIINSISDIIYMAELDANGQVVRHRVLSPQINALTGYPQSRFQDDFRFWQELILPEDQPSALEHLHQLEVGRGSEMEYRVRRSDGEVIWVRDSVHLDAVPAGPGGTVQALYGVISDFTAHKQTEAAMRQLHEETARHVLELSYAEEALATERNLLRTLIDHVPDRIYVKDLQGKKLLCNRSEAKALGFSDPSEVVGKTDFEVYPPDMAAGYAHGDQAVIQSGEPLIDHEEPALGTGTDPGWILTTKVPLRDTQGRVIGLVGIGRDITARRQVEHALQESQERLELAVQAAELGLWDWKIVPGDVVYNSRWAEMIGYTLEEVGTTVGNWERWIHPDDKDHVQALLYGHLEGRLPQYECEYRLRSKTGEWKWILARGKVVQRDKNGQPLRMIGAQLDVTPRHAAEAEREHLLRQMRTRTIELAAVAEISRQITTILDIEPLLWTVCQLIKDEFDLYHVHIYLFDPQDQLLKLVAGQGEVGRQLVANQHHIPLQHPGSLVARAARSRESVVISNVRLAPDFLPNPLLPDTQAEMALPMSLGNELIGVLDIQASSVNRFTPEDVNIQTTLAAQVAIAIHNARLFTDNARRLSIIESFRDLVALADLKTAALTPIYVNPAGVRLAGYSRADEMIGRPALDFFPPEEEHRLRREVLPVALRRGMWRGETTLLRRDGTRVPVEQTVFVIRDEHGQFRDLATIITDISQRKQAEEELAKAQALLFSAITQTPAGIMMADGTEVSVRVANAAAAEILGQPVEELVQVSAGHPQGLTWQGFFPDRRPYATDDLPLVRAVRFGELVENVEMIVRQASGDERWILTNAAPVRNARGEVIAGVVVFVDITERKRSEEALRRANRAYRALSDSNQAMVRAVDEAHLLNDICATIVNAGGYRMAWVAYVEGDPPRTLLPVARAGYDDGYVRAAAANILQEEGPTRVALRTGTPVIVRDVATDPLFIPWRDDALRRGYRSVIALPLRVEGANLGILNVYAAEPHVFDQAEINLLTELASDLAYGITVLRLNKKRQYAEEQLRRSEANLTALIENTEDSIWSVDTGHYLITMNSAMRRIFRESLGVELVPGMMATEFMPPGEQEERRAQYDRALQGERFTVEKHYEFENTLPVDVEISFNPIIGHEGEITGVSVFSRDITARKRDEEQLKQLNARLERRSQELSALYEIGRTLTGMLDVREIYRVMYEGIGRRLLGVPHFMVALYDEERQIITCDFAVVDHQEVDVAQFPPLPLGTGPNTDAIRTRQPQIMNLAAPYPGRHMIIDSINPANPLSGLYVPLISGNRVVGVLDVQDYKPDAFRETDLALVSTFANQAAAAIQNARLFAAEREQRSLAEALRNTATALTRTLDSNIVIERILDNLKAVVPHSAANIMLLDGDDIRVVGYRGYAERGLEDWIKHVRTSLARLTMLQQMAEQRLPMIISNIDRDFPGWALVPESAWVKSYAGAPIQREGRVVGFLNIYSDQPDFFVPLQTDRLQAFADQAAIAIRNAQLFTAEHEQRALAEALSNMAATLNRTLDPDVVMDRLLEHIHSVVPHDAASIMLIDEDDMAYVVRHAGFAERGLDELVSNLHFPVTRMARFLHMAETGRPVYIPETRTAPEWENVPGTEWIRSYVGAPIRFGDKMIGVLNLDSATPDFFSAQHAEYLQAFADQAAIAIQNAQLFVAEREQRVFAETVRDIAATINQTLDLDTVLDDILMYIKRVVPHDAANVMLIDGSTARLVRESGYSERGLGEWARHLSFEIVEGGLFDRVIKSRKPEAVPYTKDYPEWIEFPETEWMLSYACAPIRQGDQVTGFLSVYSTIPYFFTASHTERLQAFADQVSNAIRNAQLFAAERDQRTLAEALRDTAAAINSTLDFDKVADAILNNVGRVAPYDAADLILVENGIGRVVHTHPIPEDPARRQWAETARLVIADTPNMNTVVQTGQPFVVSDTLTYEGWADHPETRWIRSNVVAPIQREGRVTGFLILDAATPDFFTQEHAARLQAFADQAALAIHNAQLFADVQAYATQMEQRVDERTHELEQRRAQLQAILDSIGEGVIYDEKLHTRYINRALSVLTGYTQQEFTGYLEPLRGSSHSEEDFVLLIRRIYDSVTRLGLWQGEQRLRRKEGSEFDAALFVTPVKDPSGQIIGAVTVIRDISQEKALREQKDRFIASASHELRTPLANFKTRLYLLKNQPEKFEQHVAILNRVTNGMNELVENLLDVSRFERGVIPMHRRPVVLQDIVNDVVTIQAAEAERKGLTLASDLGRSPLVVFADPQRLAQVVTNLISNAINYTPTGGQVTVELRPDDEQRPCRALLCVRDTGIGIAPEMLSQVFEPFFRGNEEVGTGAGLGLTIAREIVKLHEGQIAVESETGRGSVFTVTLDLIKEP